MTVHALKQSCGAIFFSFRSVSSHAAVLSVFTKLSYSVRKDIAGRGTGDIANLAFFTLFLAPKPDRPFYLLTFNLQIISDAYTFLPLMRWLISNIKSPFCLAYTSICAFSPWQKLFWTARLRYAGNKSNHLLLRTPSVISFPPVFPIRKVAPVSCVRGSINLLNEVKISILVLRLRCRKMFTLIASVH